jgi:predicted RNase H-like nuclease (RuvC/YqgF family)
MFVVLFHKALLEQQNTAQIEEFQAAVDQAVASLTNKRLQQLVLIKTSERYLDRHVASLEMLTKHMAKCRREIHDLEDKNVDLIDATKNVQPQINSLVATTKKLKREVRRRLLGYRSVRIKGSNFWGLCLLYSWKLRCRRCSRATG